MRNRSSYLVNRKIQLELGLLITSVVLALSSIIFAVYSKYTLNLFAEVSESVSPTQTARENGERDRMAAVIGLSAIGILSLGCIAFSLRRTHRVAGPLYRIELHLDRLLAGDFENRIRLRNQDELKAIAEKLNLLTDRLAANVGSPQGDVAPDGKVGRPGQ